jgi:hypothetical protein
MAALKFFPGDPEVKATIAEIVMELANTREEAIWLGKRMVALFNEWPGPIEMRATFCSKYRPRDGHEVNSTVYLDGIPSEREQQIALPAPNPRSRITSADPAMSSAIALLAKRDGKMEV